MKTPLDNDLNKVYESFNQNYNHLRQTLMASLPDSTKKPKRAGRISQALAFTGGTIMRSRITKLAAAAVIIIVAVFGINILDKSATPAWAIEQTVEALRDANWVHFSGLAGAGDGIRYRFDAWAAANKEGTQSEDVRFEIRYKEHKQVVVVHKNVSYEYFSHNNTVYIKPGKQIIINPWVGSKFFEKIKESMTDLEVDYGKDQETGRDSVFVTCSYAPMSMSWWFQLDLETKQPVRFKQWRNVRHEGEPEFDVEKIVYEEEVPEDLFEFEIPKGAKVVKTSLLDDPSYGMSAEEMTQNKACIQICTKYWQAMIDSNWAFTHKLRPLLSEKECNAMHSKNPPVELVEVGQPYQQEGCKIGPIVPCTVRFKDSTTRDIKMIIKFREMDGKSSCIIAGTWGPEN